MTAAELSALSDQELTHEVAIEVVGWRQLPNTYPPQYYPPNLHPMSNAYGNTIPPYATSADAVLPLLSRYHNECRNNAGGGWKVLIFDYVPEYHMIAECCVPFLPFAKAASIALLLAKGAA